MDGYAPMRWGIGDKTKYGESTDGNMHAWMDRDGTTGPPKKSILIMVRGESASKITRKIQHPAMQAALQQSRRRLLAVNYVIYVIVWIRLHASLRAIIPYLYAVLCGYVITSTPNTRMKFVRSRKTHVT
eukprot:6190413-Pleurochrysis_carterae.AAC.1